MDRESRLFPASARSNQLAGYANAGVNTTAKLTSQLDHSLGAGHGRALNPWRECIH